MADKERAKEACFAEGKSPSTKKPRSSGDRGGSAVNGGADADADADDDEDFAQLLCDDLDDIQGKRTFVVSPVIFFPFFTLPSLSSS